MYLDKCSQSCILILRLQTKAWLQTTFYTKSHKAIIQKKKLQFEYLYLIPNQKNWPGGRRPWCCCHLRAWPRRAKRRDGGTTDTSPARAAAMAALLLSFVTPSGYASRGSKYERAMRFSRWTYLYRGYEYKNGIHIH